MLDVERFKEIREIYKKAEPEIMEASAVGMWIDPYFLNWWLTEWCISPPEETVWNQIKCVGHFPFYPQYPIGRYFADFACPYRKIVIEVDGKAYHDPEKDLERDKVMHKDGWKVFRIPAAKTFREGRDCTSFYELDGDDLHYDLESWLLESSDGIIRAIKAIFYEDKTGHEYGYSYGFKNPDMGNVFLELCYKSLYVHSNLVFDLPCQQSRKEYAQTLKINQDKHRRGGLDDLKTGRQVYDEIVKKLLEGT